MILEICLLDDQGVGELPVDESVEYDVQVVDACQTDEQATTFVAVMEKQQKSIKSQLSKAYDEKVKAEYYSSYSYC